MRFGMFSLILHRQQYGIVPHSVRRRMGVKKDYEKFNKKRRLDGNGAKKQAPNDPI